MEDGVADSESLVHPLNLTQGREGEEEEKSSGSVMNFISNMVSAEGSEGKKEEGEGILNNLISNLVSPLSTKEAEGANNEGAIEVEASEVQDGGSQPAKEKEDGGGGIITNLISNLVSPLSTKETGEGATNGSARGVEVLEVKGGGSESVEEKDDDGGNGGKSISNLISNLFHQDETEKKGEGVEENDEKVGIQEEEGGGGGIIDNIVSHLPASLQGDAVTSTDEATILIHSIIHD